MKHKNKFLLFLLGAGCGASFLLSLIWRQTGSEEYWIWYVIIALCLTIGFIVAKNMSKWFAAKVLVCSIIFGVLTLIMGGKLYYGTENFWVFGIAAGLVFIVFLLVKEKKQPVPPSVA